MRGESTGQAWGFMVTIRIIDSVQFCAGMVIRMAFQSLAALNVSGPREILRKQCMNEFSNNSHELIGQSCNFAHYFGDYHLFRMMEY